MTPWDGRTPRPAFAASTSRQQDAQSIANAALVGCLSAAVALFLALYTRESTAVTLLAPVFAGFVGFGVALCAIRWAWVIRRNQQAKASQDGPEGNRDGSGAKRARTAASDRKIDGFHGGHPADCEQRSPVGRAFTHGGNGAVVLTRRAICSSGKGNTEEQGES